MKKFLAIVALAASVAFAGPAMARDLEGVWTATSSDGTTSTGTVKFANVWGNWSQASSHGRQFSRPVQYKRISNRKVHYRAARVRVYNNNGSLSYSRAPTIAQRRPTYVVKF
ncbi:hypothetical protein FACS1894186_3150 [Alphaproteobacteria bacterium]|nr:hypothetical protein FACS1894186_3150 [Alphaproteobacteria bacterium]